MGIKMSNSDNNDQVEKERIINSPNISAGSNDINGLQDIIPDNRGEEQPKVNNTPTPEKELKFRTTDINRPDGKDLLVNIEGSQMRKIEEAKQQKKQQQEAEKRKKAEEQKHRHEAKVIKRNKRIKSVKNIAQKIWKLKFIFLATILAIVVIFIVIKFIIPTAHKIKEDTKTATEEKIVEEKKTPMIDIYQALAGKELMQEEFEEIVKSKNSNITIDYATDNGIISNIDGGVESIKFSFKQTGQGVTISDFYYSNYIDDKPIQLFGSGENYTYSCNYETKNFENVNDAIKEYILEMHKAGSEI